MWALGVVLFALLIGVPPFETSDVRTTYIRIRDNQYSFPAEYRMISVCLCEI